MIYGGHICLNWQSHDDYMYSLLVKMSNDSTYNYFLITLGINEQTNLCPETSR